MTEVRPLGAADEADWRRLWGAYLDFYGTTLPEAVHAASFARLVDPAVTDYRGLLAWREGGRSGSPTSSSIAMAGRSRTSATFRTSSSTPRRAGPGPGRALIEAVYALADANGTPKVYWLTQEFNTKARALYDRVGTGDAFIKYVR